MVRYFEKPLVVKVVKLNGPAESDFSRKHVADRAVDRGRRSL
jgi:hypothetical protein